MRSASGNAAAVVIDSAYRLHGGSSGAITIEAAGGHPYRSTYGSHLEGEVMVAVTLAVRCREALLRW